MKIYFCMVVSMLVWGVIEYLSIRVDNKKWKDVLVAEKILYIVSFLGMSAVVYSLYTFGLASIHSDTTINLRSLNAIIDNKSIFPVSWVDANSEYYIFHTNSIAIVIAAIVKDQCLGRMIASFIGIMLPVIANIYCSKKLFNNNSWLITTPIIFLFMQGKEAADVMVYQAAYGALVVSATFACAATYMIICNANEENNIKSLIIKFMYVIMIFLMMLCGKRYLAEFVLPILIAIFINVYFDQESDVLQDRMVLLRKLARVMIYILIPVVVGYGLYIWLGTWHDFNDNSHVRMDFIDSVDNISGHLSYMFRNIVECFGFEPSVEVKSIVGMRNLVSVSITIITCLIIPLKQLFNIKNENNRVKFFLYFGYAHNLIMIVITTLISAKQNTRYIISTVIIFVIISSRYILENWFKQDIKVCRLVSFFWGTAVLIESLSIIYLSDGWSEVYEENKELAYSIVGSGYYKGYGSFFDGLYLETFADNNLRMGPVYVDEGKIVFGSGLNYDNNILTDSGQGTCLILTEEQLGSAYQLEQQLGYPDYYETKEITKYVYGEKTEDIIYLLYYSYDIATTKDF